MHWMGGILEEIVILGLFTSDDIFSFLPDLNHGITEPTEPQINKYIVSEELIFVTYRSSSSKVSDSVGSISIQVWMGQEHVGGWKP